MASSTVIASPHKRLLDRHTQKKLAGIGRVIMILLIMIIVVLPFYVAVLYPSARRTPSRPTALHGRSIRHSRIICGSFLKMKAS